RRIRTLSFLLVCVGLGTIVAGLRRPPPAPQLNAADGETTLLEGCVVEPPIFHEGREQFVLELAPGARARVSLFLNDPSEAPALRYGQRIELSARVRQPRNYGNPGAFDFVTFLARKQIYWLASAKPGPDLRVLDGTCGHPITAFLMNLRTTALERTAKLFPDRYQAAINSALLIGEDTRLERAWTEDYRKTGTYHALVISGLHITLIASILVLLARLCWVPRTASLLATVVFVWLYAGFAGGTPPVLRSAALFTAFAIAHWFHRKVGLLNLLAAVALPFLIAEPDQLFDSSFQLSFLSVAAIGGLVRPIIDATSGRWKPALRGIENSEYDLRLTPALAEFRIELRLLAETLRWRYFLRVFEACARVATAAFEAITLTVFVQIGLVLPMVLYFHRVSLTSVVGNLLAVPLLTASVPIGYLALLTGLQAVVFIDTVLIDLARRIVEWQARLEPSWRIPNPPLIWVLLALVLLAIALYRPRPKFALTLVFASICLVLASFRQKAPEPQLELHAIDVGQGESLLLITPEGRRMLIDAGGIPTFGKHRRPALDIGEDVVSPYLFERGFASVDVIAITHAHEDHIGGLRSVIENFHPKELWIGSVPQESEAWLNMRAVAQSNQVRIRELRAGDRAQLGRLTLEAVSPDRHYTPRSEPSNDDSLALRFQHGRHRFLLTGDMERLSEFTLLDSGRLGKIDVLKVAHHGSRTSTSDAFLQLANPSIAIISAGYANMYRHPHVDTLRRLEKNHIATYRTDQMGLIRVRSDGRYLDVQPYSFRLRDSEAQPR
ncbi:MAG TPA: DNA internalization-related competence protein ComEC/Rec2, partial [Bryobacteraceae bacterium]|nr:DNA internalization-related competence protein ComEC/Rec2 [Bryobacteraceae bacterium]